MIWLIPGLVFNAYLLWVQTACNGYIFTSADTRPEAWRKACIIGLEMFCLVMLIRKVWSKRKEPTQ